ncbi:MAG: c-type cytochrome biogenesis protein CcmI [bacterium]
MSAFIVATGLLVLIGIAMITPATLRRYGAWNEQADRKDDNVRIARDRLSELQAEFDNGRIDEAAFTQATEELEQGLLQDIGSGEQQASRNAKGFGRAAWVGLVVVVPLLAVVLYQYLGAPQHLDVAGPGKPAPRQESPSLEELVVQLQARLQESPEDAEGWFLLGRTLASMRRYSDAVVALEKAVEFSERHPAAMVALADALAMTNNATVDGRALELVNEVLDQQPDNLTALWMAGKAARQAGEFQKAIDYWSKVEPHLSEQPQVLSELRGLIEDTRQQAQLAGVAVTVPHAVPPAEISLQVEVDAAMAGDLPDNAVLFVFAKRVAGPPMPVAAIRLPAKGFPMAVVMNDTHLLQPGGRLSDFEQLSLTARVSMSGQPMATAGDLQSGAIVVSPTSGAPVTLRIDQKVP